MIILLSPAKSLDFESKLPTDTHSQPAFLDDSQQLIDQLRKLTPPDIESLMKISQKLADLNFGRFLNWQAPFTLDNARPAALAFTGDVYQGFDAASMNEKDYDFAQKHVGILSGLYGLLKPMDLIQPYRLEMGTKFVNNRGKNLYEFWGDKITDAINQQETKTVVNLASNEYFKAVNKKRLQATLVTPVFKDYKNGQYKIISFYAKKARGLMTAYAIKNRINEVEKLKSFDSDGYYFSPEQSKANEWVFLRDEQ